MITLTFLKAPTRTTTTKIQNIVKQVMAWDYVPSVKCLRETFNISDYSARRIFNKIVSVKGLPFEYQYKLHTRKGRGVLQKMLKNLDIANRVFIYSSNFPLKTHEPTRNERLKHNIKKQIKQVKHKISEIPIISILS